MRSSLTVLLTKDFESMATDEIDSIVRQCREVVASLAPAISEALATTKKTKDKPKSSDDK